MITMQMAITVPRRMRTRFTKELVISIVAPECKKYICNLTINPVNNMINEFHFYKN
jgi:hypothetical protein